MSESSPSRSCGSCTACCTAIGVQELDKPAGVRCAHLRPRHAKPCGIYEVRPPGCHLYACAWLQGVIPRRDRPDRIGVVFDSTREGLVRAVDVWPGAHLAPRVQAIIQVLAREGFMVHVPNYHRPKALPIAGGS